MAAFSSNGEVAVMVNGQSRLAVAGSSLHDLVEAVGCAGKPIAVEVDGHVVPRARHAEVRLAGGERIEIVTFVGGG
jgi:sulfur carrier protein